MMCFSSVKMCLCMEFYLLFCLFVLLLLSLMFFFFFQAEDGIRDLTVTGVQTCALPIWPSVRRRRAPSRGAQPDLQFEPNGHGPGVRNSWRAGVRLDVQVQHGLGRHEIGRASCRERV